MAPLQSRYLFACVFLAITLHVAGCVKVILGDQFIVPENCESGESGTFLRVLTRSVTREVGLEIASYQSGKWQVSREFADRMKSNAASKIVFSRILFTDGGMYEVSCSTSGTKLVQLEVVFASKESVTEDETAILPCYFDTSGKKGLTPRWEKNGTPLCVQNLSSDGCSWTPTGNRMSVPPDWLRTGNVSLIVERAQPGDSGVYFCYVQDQNGNHSGNPAAARLAVIKKTFHQITSTASPRNQTQSCSEQAWKISTVVLILVLCSLVALVCLWRHGKLGCDSGKLYEVVNIIYPPSQQNEANI